MANKVKDEVIQFEKDLTFVRNFLDKLPKEVNRLYDLIGKKDQEKVDLLHHIEFVRLPAHKGWNAYNQLHIVLNERREAKDLYEVMNTVNDLIKGKVSTSAISTALGEVRKIVKQQDTRSYNPRRLKELNYGCSNKVIT